MITKNSDPRVSVIIPVYNRKGFLCDCIASVLATNYPNLEVIVVDDGSSDGSYQYASELARCTPGKIRVITHPYHQNLGISASRNLGILNASGDILAFLDSDDCFTKSRFHFSVAALVVDQDVDAVYEPVSVVDISDSLNDHSVHHSISCNSVQKCPSQHVIQATSRDPLQWFFMNQWWLMPGITIRRSFFDDHSPFRLDLPVAEDTELWMRMAATGRIRCAQSFTSVAIVKRHSMGHSWDRYSWQNSAYFYRSALLKCLHSVSMRPQLYLNNAPAAIKTRYRSAVADDFARLIKCRSLVPLVNLVVEALLNHPESLLSKRIVGDLYMAVASFS